MFNVLSRYTIIVLNSALTGEEKKMIGFFSRENTLVRRIKKYITTESVI